MKQHKIRKAVIPVAGLGTRMLPATKAIPKEMLPVMDKPLIQYVVKEATISKLRSTKMADEVIYQCLQTQFRLRWP